MLLSGVLFQVMSKSMKLFTSELVSASRSATLEVAAEVKGVVPHHDHIFTDSKVNAALARRVLLDDGMRSKLTEKFKGLHAMMRLTSSLKSSSRVVGDEGEDALDADWEAAKATLGTARDALTVIAGARVLYALPREAAKNEAHKLLSKPRPELKKSMIDALTKLAAS